MPFLEVVRRSGAAAFVMENVPQLLDSVERDRIVLEARDMGFMTVSAKMCAADYGVAQNRTRAFIVGCRVVDPGAYFPPPRTHYNPREGTRSMLDYGPDAQPWRTLRDALGDLEPPQGTAIRDVPPPYDLHFHRSPTTVSIARYKAIPREGMNREDLLRLAPDLTPQCWVNKKGGTDLFGRLWWDRPAFTIQTEFFKPEKGRYLHPSQHRPITHREAARLQSFLDGFTFTGSKIEIARQVGNAVPPLLASAVARSVRAMLDDESRL